MTFALENKHKMESISEECEAKSMNMIDIMTRNVITVHETDNIATVCDIMTHAKTRHVIVVQASGKIQGIISDRDCNLALQSPFKDGNPMKFAESIEAWQIMASMPHCITAQASVAEAAQLMLEYKISALPIMRDGTLIGIVTTTDLLKVLVTVSV